MIEVTKLKCRGGYRLHAMFYNFTRKQAALKMTPAMAADVTDRVWGMSAERFTNTINQPDNGREIAVQGI